MTHRMTAEIFATGTWGAMTGQRDTYTIADLDEMVRAFNELYPETHRPPLRLGGHDHTLAPAVGWVDRIWRDGEKLLAEFTDVPTVVFEAIQAGRYDSVSSGIHWNRKIGETVYPRLLHHAAILGAEVPAVKGLKPLRTLLSEDEAECHVYSQTPVETRVYTEQLSKESDMGEQEERARAERAEQELKDMKAANVKKDEENEKLAKRLYSETSERDASEVREFCEAAVKDGRMTPATRDEIEKALKDEHNYSDEGKLSLPFRITRLFSEAAPKAPMKGEGGHSKGKDSGDGGDSAEDRMETKVVEYAERHDCTKGEAFKKVRNLHPELTREYLMETTGQGGE